MMQLLNKKSKLYLFLGIQRNRNTHLTLYVTMERCLTLTWKKGEKWLIYRAKDNLLSFLLRTNFVTKPTLIKKKREKKSKPFILRAKNWFLIFLPNIAFLQHIRYNNMKYTQ